MADISFYKYLEAAFRYKLFHPEGQRISFDTYYNYLGYNLTYKQLFFYARRILPKFYTSEFPDTEEGNLQMAKKVLEKLDKHQDTQLENQFKAITTSEENAQIVIDAQAQSQMAGAQQAPPAGTAADTSSGLPGLPSAPSITSVPRMPGTVHNIPHTPEPSKPEIAIPPSASRRFNFSALRPPASLVNTFKRFGSGLGIFAKRNMLGVTSGIFAGVGGFLGGKIAGAPGVLFGAIGAGSLPSLVKSGAVNLNPGSVFVRGAGGIGNFISGLSNRIPGSGPGGVGSLKIKGLGTGRKVAAAFLLFGLLFGFSFFAAFSQPPTTLEASPQNQVSGGLDFTLPLRDPSIIPQDVRPTILQSWPNAQIDNWQTIIDQAIAHNWNPGVLLTLWIEESGAQGVPASDPLGCDVRKPTTDIQISLGCFFNSFDSKFANDQFPQFLLTYSSPGDPIPFKTNPDFPGNFKYWYSKLVPTGPGAIKPVTQTTAASCPIPKGVIKNPSYQAYLLDPFKGGHCSPSYGNCPSNSRRAQAIDVDTRGQSVIFPTINNQSVAWVYVPTELTLTGNDCEGGNPNCGKFYIFKATAGSDTWFLHLLHIDPATVAFDRTDKGNLSGSVVGNTVPGIYVHIEIGKNIVNYQNPPLGSADFDPGWIPADFMCK